MYGFIIVVGVAVGRAGDTLSVLTLSHAAR